MMSKTQLKLMLQTLKPLMPNDLEMEVIDIEYKNKKWIALLVRSKEEKEK